ncbi:MAG TPA: serine hydrolase [Burkholderiaceae bacterium]
MTDSTSTPAGRLDSTESQPARLGLMQGAPPDRAQRVRLMDNALFTFPQLRWAFSNVRQLVPTANVWRGDGPVAVLAREERNDIDALAFEPLGGTRPMRWDASLAANYTDGIVVLHRGRIVYERYFGALQAHVPHLAWSVTKSLVGVIAASLVAEGVLDESARVDRLLPELKGGGWTDASVRDLSNMTTALQYFENFDDPRSEVWWHLRSGGLAAALAGATGPASFDEFMRGVRPSGSHGQKFAYKTVNTDVLAWIMRRLTRRTLAQLVQERVWAKLGAEQDGFFVVDSEGTEYAGGGFNAALRDIARFGEMVRCGGFYNGSQVVPGAAIEDIHRGADPAHLAAAGIDLLRGWSYRHMWWVSHAAHRALYARGMHGQGVYVDPAAEMVIARFASHPERAGSAVDPTTLPAYDALARHLMRG